MTTIHNTLTRQKKPFTPINPKSVRMYVYDMIVCDYYHLGHVRVMVVSDMIARQLRECGYLLTYVCNITDIDNKIIARAAENGETIDELTTRFIQATHEDIDVLGVLRPDIESEATENIPQMIAVIETPIQGDRVYPTINGDVYYAMCEFFAYEQLPGKSLDDLRVGERVEVNGFKCNLLDFVLWKTARAGEPAWENPWGNGCLGWHVECPAMSESLFDDIFDIYGGGADLQLPHRENKITQSASASGHTCDRDHTQTHHDQSIASHVRYWLHNGFTRMNSKKISKSLGNFFTIHEVLKQYDLEVVRFFILCVYYHSPLSYPDAHLGDAKGALTRLYTTLKNTPAVASELSENADDYTRRLYATMNNDSGTVEAIAVLFELIGGVSKTSNTHLAGHLEILGGIISLLRRDPAELLQDGVVSDGLSNEEIEDLVARCKQVCSDKGWAESDRIRDFLNEYKIILEDNAGGTTWRRG